MINEQPSIEDKVYAYGRLVVQRERAACCNVAAFDEYNSMCLTLWHELCALGAYADSECSVFKDEYRAFYFDGLDNG